MVQVIRLITLIVFGIVALTGCRDAEVKDARLLRVASIVNDSPKDAIAALDSIDPSALAEPDRQYYNFLTIKANDKAYITHTSDSLILTLLDYYAGEPLYPEVLYYAGRVYSDLGDAPTALEYFQKGLDKLPDNPSDAADIHLKGCLLSQTAQLLNSLRLYSEAIPYMKEAIEMDKLERDTFNIAYDKVLLCYIYRQMENFNEAENQIQEAIRYAASLTDRDQAVMHVYLANVKYKQNQIDSALKIIRGIKGKDLTRDTNFALITASRIYLAAGMPDSAYYYANKLIHSDNPNNRRNGYQIILGPEMIEKIPADSLTTYIKRYYTDMEDFLNRNESQQALIQHSLYNYTLQERERYKAEQSNSRLLLLSASFIIIIIIAIFIIIRMRMRRKLLKVRLAKAISDIERLQLLNECDKTSLPDKVDKSTNDNIVTSHTSDLTELRTNLLDRIKNFSENSGYSAENLPDIIVAADIYQMMQTNISIDKPIPDKKEIWDNIESLVLSVWPNFKNNLLLISDTLPKEAEYRMALLIKLGFTPKEISILMGRDKTTISYRRKNLCKSLLGGEIELKYLNDIIRCI